ERGVVHRGQQLHRRRRLGPGADPGRGMARRAALDPPTRPRGQRQPERRVLRDPPGPPRRGRLPRRPRGPGLARGPPLPPPEPPGATTVPLTPVPCPAPATCPAAGQYNDSTGAAQTLAEAWNGTTWTIEPAVTPAGAGFLSLSSVSCNAPSACV